MFQVFLVRCYLESRDLKSERLFLPAGVSEDRGEGR